MALVRYGTNVFELDDVYGLDLYESDGIHVVQVILRRGETSFKIKYDSHSKAQRAFETICDELDVRELTPTHRPESVNTG